MNAALSSRRVAALCRKEFFQIGRDPSSILIAFVLPVVMLLIFGYGINLDISALRVGLVMEDDSPAARDFAESLTRSPYLEVRPGGTRSELAAALAAGRLRGGVVVAEDFSRELARPGATAPVQVITDGSDPNTASLVEATVRGAWQVWQEQRGRARGEAPPPGIGLEPRYWYNPSALSRNYLVPGSITIIMSVIGALLTSLVIAREWERGTMEALLSTPVSKAELLLSKLIPYYLLGLVAMAVCVVVTVAVIGVPFRGSLAALFLATSLFLGATLGLGLLISTVTRSQFNAAQGALNGAFLPAVILSGFLFEISSMPAFVRGVTRLIPARYFVNALQTLFQAGTVWPLLWPDFAFLAAAAAFFIGLTARRTRRGLE